MENVRIENLRQLKQFLAVIESILEAEEIYDRGILSFKQRFFLEGLKINCQFTRSSTQREQIESFDIVEGNPLTERIGWSTVEKNDDEIEKLMKEAEGFNHIF